MTSLPSMTVVVASGNPVKLGATRSAFERLFAGSPLEVVSVAVASGVGDQPDSDEETRNGARKRALNARQARRLYPAISGIGGIGATVGSFLVAGLARVMAPEELL